jgi:hypothetical protein
MGHTSRSGVHFPHPPGGEPSRVDRVVRAHWRAWTCAFFWE